MLLRFPSSLREVDVFREQLPAGCPPSEAEQVSDSMFVIRLVKGRTPSDSDFNSLKAMQPNRNFGRNECRARGVSVFTKLGDAEGLLKLPAHKGESLCLVELDDGAGFIQRTGERWESHHTWWPLANYNILANCIVV